MFSASRCGIEATASWTFFTRLATVFSVARRWGGTTSRTIGKEESRSANDIRGTVSPRKHGPAITLFGASWAR